MAVNRVDVEDEVWDCVPDHDCDDDGGDFGLPVFTSEDCEKVATQFAKISAALLSARVNARNHALRSLLGAQADVAAVRAYLLSHSFSVSMASATVSLGRASAAIEEALVHLHAAFLVAERSPDDQRHRLHHEAESLSLAAKAACHLLQAAANFLKC